MRASISSAMSKGYYRGNNWTVVMFTQMNYEQHAFLFGGRAWYLNVDALKSLSRFLNWMVPCANLNASFFSFIMSLAHPGDERFPICARIDVHWWNYCFGSVVEVKYLIRWSVIKWTLFLNQASNVWTWLLSCWCSHSFCL